MIEAMIHAHRDKEKRGRTLSACEIRDLPGGGGDMRPIRRSEDAR